MKSIIFLLSFQIAITFLYFKESEGTLCKRPVDITFAIDASGSVGHWGFFKEKDFVNRVVRRFGISRTGTHAAVIVYSTKARVEIPFTKYNNYARFYLAVRRLPYYRGVTRIDLALKTAAQDVFSTEGGARRNVPKILIVMTDGYQTRTTDAVPLDKAVLPLKAKGVKVYALAIGPYTKDYELRLIVEKKENVFRSKSFSGLAHVIRRLATTTCINALPKAFAIYPLNQQKNGRDIGANRAPTGILNSVRSSSGPYGRPGGSFYLRGTSDSYIDFPNYPRGKLDTLRSISIFLWIYHKSKPGPIVNYRRKGHGIGLWLSGKPGMRRLKGHIYSRRYFYRRKIYSFKLQPRKWYYVGLTYDNKRGVAVLWVNGRVVSSTRVGHIYLATQHPVRIGAVKGIPQYFRGRVTCLQIYGMALNPSQIATIKKKCAARDQKDPCLSSPCKNGGSCIVDEDEKTGYRCRCRPGYRGHTCEVKPPRPTARPTGRPTGTPTIRSTTGSPGRIVSPTPSARQTSTPSGTPGVTTPGVTTNIPGFRIEIVEYINRFRRLHGAGPLILSTRISVAAQNWAQTLVARGTTSIDPNTSYGTNVFTRVGTQTGLAQTVVITWYTSVKYYDWARRKPKVLALPFIHMIWLSSNFVGVGLARSPSSKFYVVVYFDPMPGNKDPLLKDNVLPYTDVYILMQNVYCNPGYKKHEGTCYRFHTDKQTWDGALFQSAKDNATLVSFHASHEEAFVQTLVPPGNTGLIWTGLNDRITEGTYTWSDGTSVEYTTWKANEPTGKKEDCVGVEVIRYGTMSDVPCTEPHYYVSRQPLEGLITYRTKLQFVSLLWTDEFGQSTSLLYMQLKEKIESQILVIFKKDQTFVSGYVEQFSKRTRTRSQPTISPTKPGVPTPGYKSTSSGPTSLTQATAATTPTSRRITTSSTSRNPTVTVSLILKFGPGVDPDPTKPIQNLLRKNLGRLPAPVNQKTLIQSVRIVHPGVSPAVLGTCTSSCLTTCVISCNPFCCNSRIAASNNAQYPGMRHTVIAQASQKGYIMPNSRAQVNSIPVQLVAPQSRPMSYPVTLSVRCIPQFLRPCPPGTQVSQTVQGSYNIPLTGIPGRKLQPQTRPFVALPQLTLPRTPLLTPGYQNQRAFLPNMFPSSMQSPCIPSAFNPCPPQTKPPLKSTSVIDSPIHVMHLPTAPRLPSMIQPPKPPTMKPTSVVDTPLHVIHLPPVPPPSSFMQPPCIPSAYNSCPPVTPPTMKPTSVVDTPLHVIHLPPPPPAFPLVSPPSTSFFLQRPSFVPVMCIPRPYYPCPPKLKARKLSKPLHRKGKSRTFKPKPILAAYPYPYGVQSYPRPSFVSYIPFAPPAMSPSFLSMQQRQYQPQPFGLKQPFPFYANPIWPQMMQRPVGIVPVPQLRYATAIKKAVNDNPKQPNSNPKPIPAKGPISLQGSLFVYPKQAPAIPPLPPPVAPQMSYPCIPSPYNRCVPIPPFSMTQRPFQVVNPCIPSLANPCLTNVVKPTTKPTKTAPKAAENKPILLTRPLQLQGSVYIKSSPARSGTAYPAATPCIPTVSRPCYPVRSPGQPLRPQGFVSPKTLNVFSRVKPLQPLQLQQPIRNVASPVSNLNVPQQSSAASQSFVVELPEISLHYPAPAPPSLLPAFPYQAQARNCPISCVLRPGPFCPPYCSASCCKRKSANHHKPKTKSQKEKPKAKKRTQKIRKIKKPKNG